MMKVTDKTCLELTAEDLMSCPVQVVSEHAPLRDAAHRMRHENISGMPVVCADGRCVGVLSMTDIAHWADDSPTADRERRAADACGCTEWQVIEVETLPTDAVSRYMTADPVTVRPTATIREVARRMVDAHIHRVVVVDDARRPVGLVSSTDLVAAIAYCE